MKKLSLLLLIGAFSFSFLHGQNVSGNKFHFELEPLQFVNDGWSIVGHYAVSKHL